MKNYKILDQNFKKIFYSFERTSRLALCCNHAAAVMLRVEVAVCIGLTSEDEACTSRLCKWKDMSQKQLKPSKLQQTKEGANRANIKAM